MLDDLLYFSTLIYEQILTLTSTKTTRDEELLCLCVYFVVVPRRRGCVLTGIFSLFRSKLDKSLSENTAQLHYQLARVPCRNPNVWQLEAFRVGGFYEMKIIFHF